MWPGEDGGGGGPADADVIIEVGAEGATMTLHRRHEADGDRFFVVVDSGTALELLDELTDDDGDVTVRRSRTVASFDDALQLCDEECATWPMLWPLAVHPDYRAVVLALVEARHATTAERLKMANAALGRWQEICDGSQTDE